MTKNISQIAMLGLLTAAFITAPALSRAADTEANMPGASDQTAPAKPKKHGVPFHGKLAAKDAEAMTITVGTMLIHVTTDTKIIKDGKPATLADGVVGEPVGGAYQKTEDGQLNATVVRFGAKAEDKDKAKPEKQHKESPENGDTN